MKIELFAGLLVSFTALVPAFASEHFIRVDSFSYPSKAAVHLELLQGALAEEAIKTCGSKEAVQGLSSLKFTATEKSLTRPVAVLSADGSGLDLWYPVLSAEAKVSCQDE